MQSYFCRRHMITWLLMAWIASLLMVDSWSHAANVIEPELIIRQQLINHLLSDTAIPSLRQHEMTKADVRMIVQHNLNPKIFASAVKVKGVDFRFTRTGQQTEGQVAVLILDYATDTRALRMEKKLSERSGYFRHTKILTPFSYASVGDRLVIAFTENAGDDEIVQFINEVPAILKQ